MDFENDLNIEQEISEKTKDLKIYSILNEFFQMREYITVFKIFAYYLQKEIEKRNLNSEREVYYNHASDFHDIDILFKISDNKDLCSHQITVYDIKNPDCYFRLGFNFKNKSKAEQYPLTFYSIDIENDILYYSPNKEYSNIVKFQSHYNYSEEKESLFRILKIMLEKIGYDHPGIF